MVLHRVSQHSSPLLRQSFSIIQASSQPVQAEQGAIRQPSVESDAMDAYGYEDPNGHVLLCLTQDDYWDVLAPFLMDPAKYSQKTFAFQVHSPKNIANTGWLGSAEVSEFIAHYCGQVTGLWIDHLWFRELAVMMHFISHFPFITTLEILRCNWMTAGNLEQFGIENAPSYLDTLSVDHCEPDSAPLATWLATASCNIERINWAFYLGHANVSTHTALMQQNMNTLTHLCLDVRFLIDVAYGPGAVVAPETSLDLSMNEKLEWLTITGPIIFDSIPSNLLLVSLGNVKSKVLKNIEYHINPSTVQDLDTFEYSPLEEFVLDDEKFPALEMVDFQIHRGFGLKPLAPFDDLKTALLLKLPELMMAGKLEVNEAVPEDADANEA